VNIEQLRRVLRTKWLSYYKENREWLTRLGVWVNYEGQRRPSSSFILATLSVLEPQVCKMMSFVVDLNNNPDRIVSALGLNFNPEIELSSLDEQEKAFLEDSVKMLPAAETAEFEATTSHLHPAQTDEMCEGVGRQSSVVRESIG
jgi:hypothetical protein